MHLCGSIVDLKKGYAKVTLPCSKDMSVDNLGLIHGGFIFGAADFAAMAAVNEPTVVLIGSKTRFLAPAKIGDVVEFEAKANECKRTLEAGLPLPAYDLCMLASNTFNVLDARKAISQTERQNYILKIRELSKACAELYKEQESDRVKRVQA